VPSLSQAGRASQLSGIPDFSFQFGRLPSVIGGPGGCLDFISMTFVSTPTEA
jgi:hypothetical protein